MRRLIVFVTLTLLAISTMPSQAQSALGPGMWDENVPQIVFSGVTWSRTADALNFGGYRMVTGQTTSTAPRIDFKVWGDGFTVYIVRNAVGADTNICINGVCQSLSFYSAAGTYTSVSYTNLGWGGDGVHDVYIQKSNNDNENILFDALYVSPHVAFPTSIQPTPIVVVTVNYPTPATQTVNIANWSQATLVVESEITEDPIRESWDVDGQTVAIEYRYDVGQVVMTVLLLMVLFVMLVMMTLFLRGKQAQ